MRAPFINIYKTQNKSEETTHIHQNKVLTPYHKVDSAEMMVLYASRIPNNTTEQKIHEQVQDCHQGSVLWIFINRNFLVLPYLESQ